MLRAEAFAQDAVLPTKAQSDAMVRGALVIHSAKNESFNFVCIIGDYAVIGAKRAFI